jgi:hypothetical protein
MATKNLSTKDTTAITTTSTPVTLDQLGTEGVAGMIGQADAAALQAMMAAGQLEAAEQMLTLEKGQQITGVLYESGTSVIEDKNTKLPKEVRTWKIELRHPQTWAPGPRVSILGSAQLDRQLDSILSRSQGIFGQAVVIARGGETKTGKGNNMTEYFVAIDKSRTPTLAPTQEPKAV